MKNRIGEERNNIYGSKMIIVNYRKSEDIDIYFPEYDCTVYNKQYGHFKRGNIKCPYDKTILDIGYLGEGQYKTTNGQKGCLKDNSLEYEFWYSMLRRCYDTKFQKKHPTYKDCSVCNEWHNFQNFAKWCNENYYEIEDRQMNLDKDILNKGNKLYCPDKCIFVPDRINCLFVKCNKTRGKYPIGVNYITKDRAYISQCGIKNDKGQLENIYLGRFNTPEEAFYVYKQFKENYIKEVAEEYKDRIPQKLYEAMYRYEVEITD